MIRGGLCFIYLESTDPSPLYAFSLADVLPEIEDPDHPDKWSCTVSPVANTNKSKPSLVTVLLRNKKRKKVSYEFTFDTEVDPGVAKKFIDVVQRNGKACSRPVEGKVVAEQSDKTKGDAGAKGKEAAK